MKLYAIKDKGAGFTQIFTAPNNYAAQRMLTDTVNAPQPSLLTQYPGDFSLYCLGDLDQDTGVISPKTDFIIEAVNVKKNVLSPDSKGLTEQKGD